jgi:hypothetical protein
MIFINLEFCINHNTGCDLFLVMNAFQHKILVKSIHPVNSYIPYQTLMCNSSLLDNLSLAEVQAISKFVLLARDTELSMHYCEPSRQTEGTKLFPPQHISATPTAFRHSKTNEMHFLYSVYCELTASMCFEHKLIIFRRRYTDW